MSHHFLNTFSVTYILRSFSSTITTASLSKWCHLVGFIFYVYLSDSKNISLFLTSVFKIAETSSRPPASPIPFLFLSHRKSCKTSHVGLVCFVYISSSLGTDLYEKIWDEIQKQESKWIQRTTWAIKKIWKFEVFFLIQPCPLNLCSALNQLNQKPRRSPLNNRVSHAEVGRVHKQTNKQKNCTLNTKPFFFSRAWGWKCEC